eukprot:gb/GEZN01008355.1/.p1 GENE.gb/GEZN01008355.1/~~gb/GEZN01008355.1/.p1  ORF type:complete len:390 (+),score=45.31 gb/GEZN01008355.1/:118-1287(+)
MELENRSKPQPTNTDGAQTTQLSLSGPTKRLHTPDGSSATDDATESAADPSLSVAVRLETLDGSIATDHTADASIPPAAQRRTTTDHTTDPSIPPTAQGSTATNHTIESVADPSVPAAVQRLLSPHAPEFVAKFGLDHALGTATVARCPFLTQRLKGTMHFSAPVAVAMQHGSHIQSTAQAALLRDIGGGDTIRVLCTRFYEHAFRDKVLDSFMWAKDGAEAHGKRLADWIVQKMGGEGEPWTESGRAGERQPSHAKAWNSRKRPAHLRGRRFKLDDCRMWLRIMFWSCRELGLDTHPFFDWYVDFLGHFVGVYERAAPAYARESAQWSGDPRNIQKYLNQGRIMLDILGVGVPGGTRFASGQLPAMDDEVESNSDSDVMDSIDGLVIG